jgi:hypothetical protein
MFFKVRFPFAVLLLLALAGCQTLRPAQGLLESKAPHATISSLQLRALLTDAVPRFADGVEETADQIITQCNDTQIRKNAILWKTNSISACFQAASRGDALAAYLDMWILCRQMTQLFETPSPSPFFGPWQGLAIERSRHLEQLMREIDARLGEEAPIGEEFVTAFASEFPVHTLYFDRESLANRYIEQVDEPTRELMHVVASMDESISEMQKLAARYAELLPKQARWQADLMLIETTQQALVAQPLQDLSKATQAVDRMAATVEQLPALVAREREALRAIVTSERQETLQYLEHMRTATLEELSQERVAILDAMGKERAAVTESVSAVTRDTLDQVDAMLASRGQQVALWSSEFFRLTFLRGLLALIVCGMIGVGLRLARGRRPASHDPDTHFPSIGLRQAA